MIFENFVLSSFVCYFTNVWVGAKTVAYYAAYNNSVEICRHTDYYHLLSSISLRATKTMTELIFENFELSSFVCYFYECCVGGGAKTVAYYAG
jgi:hypothetical protein